jgi:hypothetical protein
MQKLQKLYLGDIGTPGHSFLCIVINFTKREKISLFARVYNHTMRKNRINNSVIYDLALE